MPDLPDTWWAERVLFRTEVGSTAHGTGLPGGEDYDEVAVITEPLRSLAGCHPIKDTIIYRPGRSHTERSGPGDWDLTVYTARKWARLAGAGNPSILVSMFGPRIDTTPAGLTVLDNPQWFWSDRARQRFLGYSRSQRQRVTGERGGRHTNRPELVAEHGYDTKYAMHAVRLGMQGVEYLSTGRLVLPIDGERGSTLRAIRRGELTLPEVLDLSTELEAELEEGFAGAAPPEPDWDAIDGWLISLLDITEAHDP